MGIHLMTTSIAIGRNTGPRTVTAREGTQAAPYPHRSGPTRAVPQLSGESRRHRQRDVPHPAAHPIAFTVTRHANLYPRADGRHGPTAVRRSGSCPQEPHRERRGRYGPAPRFDDIPYPPPWQRKPDRCRALLPSAGGGPAARIGSERFDREGNG